MVFNIFLYHVLQHAMEHVSGISGCGRIEADCKIVMDDKTSMALGVSGIGDAVGGSVFIWIL